MSRPRRVLIASRIFAPEIGAAAFRLKALADALARHGAGVRVLTSTPPGTASGDASKMHGVSRFPVMRDASGYVRGYVQYLSFDIPLFFRLLTARADVVVAEPPPTTGFVVAVTSWLRRCPYVYYAADIWSDALAATSAPKIVTRLLRVVERTVLRKASLVLAVSETVAQRLAELGVPSERVVDVGNGVDTSVFRPDGDRASVTKPCFVYAGTMSEWQGAQVFIEALPEVLTEHPDTRLHFFGQGTAEESLRTLAEKTAPDHVDFHGLAPSRDVAKWLRRATAALVSIVPGTGYDLAKPTKIYAAAACGTPVLFAGSAAGGDIVESENLGHQAIHDPHAVARLMCQMITEERGADSERSRVSRSTWAFRHASLEVGSGRAAESVLHVISRDPVRGAR